MTEQNNNLYKTEIFTGIRPTGSLTVANYLGAVKPIVELQNNNSSLMVFVADLHALTDHEPEVVKKYNREVVADYLALGIDPKITKIFLQSDIENEIMMLTAYLSRLVTVAELMRVPALKDKLKDKARPENANVLLALYPIIMASDILLQRSHLIPVGEDQISHIEFARQLARNFNKKYGETLPEPKALAVKSLRILSLKGNSKMSKSEPNGAIFLMDTPEMATKKIKGAETAFAGVMNNILNSHIEIALGLTKDEKEQKEIADIISEHKNGLAVMGKFKQALTKIVNNFLNDFQIKRAKIIKNEKYIDEVLAEGKIIAQTNALETLNLVKKAMYK